MPEFPERQMLCPLSLTTVHQNCQDKYQLEFFQSFQPIQRDDHLQKGLEHAECVTDCVYRSKGNIQILDWQVWR